MEGDRIGLGAWEALEMTANVGDDVDEFVELSDTLLVNLVWFWPVLYDEHAFGPAEILPDSLGDEWRKWMKHDENLLERGFKKGGIFPEFLALEEPVGVFVPDEVIQEVSSLGEAIVVEKPLDFFVGFVDLVADPVFAVVVDFDFSGALWVFVDNLLNETRDIPEFVAEIAASNNFAGAKCLINAGGAAGDKAKTKSI